MKLIDAICTTFTLLITSLGAIFLMALAFAMDIETPYDLATWAGCC